MCSFRLIRALKVDVPMAYHRAVSKDLAIPLCVDEFPVSCELDQDPAFLALCISKGMRQRERLSITSVRSESW
jgi:hypothetical protein